MASGLKCRKGLSLSECLDSFVFVLNHICLNFAKGLCFGAYHMILLRKLVALHPICVSSNNPPFNYNRPQATHNNTPGTNPKLHHGQIQYCELKIKGCHRSRSRFYTCNKQKKVKEKLLNNIHNPGFHFLDLKFQTIEIQSFWAKSQKNQPFSILFWGFRIVHDL